MRKFLFSFLVYRLFLNKKKEQRSKTARGNGSLPYYLDVVFGFPNTLFIPSVVTNQVPPDFFASEAVNFFRIQAYRIVETSLFHIFDASGIVIISFSSISIQRSYKI